MNRYEALQDPRNKFSYWKYVGLLAGIPTPRTITFTPKNPTLEKMMESLRIGEEIDIPWEDQLLRLADKIGYPLFMRNGETSAKFLGFSGPVVRKPSDLIPNLKNILIWHAGQQGMPAAQSIILREYLRPSPVIIDGEIAEPFRAFGRNSQLLVGAERRWLVKGEEILDHFPYWPADDIRKVNPSIEESEWRHRLSLLNQETEEEVNLLTRYAIRAGRILQILDLQATARSEAWAVDFMKVERGARNVWVAIDYSLADCAQKPNSKE